MQTLSDVRQFVSLKSDTKKTQKHLQTVISAGETLAPGVFFSRVFARIIAPGYRPESCTGGSPRSCAEVAPERPPAISLQVRPNSLVSEMPKVIVCFERRSVLVPTLDSTYQLGQNDDRHGHFYGV